MKSRYISFDLIRLALVAKYGGVYMDLSYIMLENFNWLINITKYPSNLIFNRYGKRPNNFMFFHPHYGSPFMWDVDPKVNSKIGWQLGY
jgi:mannosyltransferase OCH1-like enzyme